MSVSSVAMKAYNQALQTQTKAKAAMAKSTPAVKPSAEPGSGFGDAIRNSLDKVNEMQNQKASMVEDFATGKNTNVHELMIQLQKAGMAINMTSAVRNKILTAYQEIMRMQF